MHYESTFAAVAMLHPSTEKVTFFRTLYAGRKLCGVGRELGEHFSDKLTPYSTVWRMLFSNSIDVNAS
jgi:hypothetical protein